MIFFCCISHKIQEYLIVFFIAIYYKYFNHYLSKGENQYMSFKVFITDESELAVFEATSKVTGGMCI